jgi:hypothetical protein
MLQLVKLALVASKPGLKADAVSWVLINIVSTALYSVASGFISYSQIACSDWNCSIEPDIYTKSWRRRHLSQVQRCYIET